MGGFEHSMVDEPERVKRLEKALNEFRIYLKAVGLVDEDGYDWTGLTRFCIFKDENEGVFYSVKPNGEKIVSERVKDCFSEDVCRQLREGKWLVWWFEIRWLHKIPLSVLYRLKTACEENDCLWFWNDLASTYDRLDDLVSKMIHDAFKGEEVKMERFGEW